MRSSYFSLLAGLILAAIPSVIFGEDLVLKLPKEGRYLIKGIVLKSDQGDVKSPRVVSSCPLPNVEYLKKPNVNLPLRIVFAEPPEGHIANPVFFIETRSPANPVLQNDFEDLKSCRLVIGNQTHELKTAYILDYGKRGDWIYETVLVNVELDVFDDLCEGGNIRLEFPTMTIKFTNDCVHSIRGFAASLDKSKFHPIKVVDHELSETWLAEAEARREELKAEALAKEEREAEATAALDLAKRRVKVGPRSTAKKMLEKVVENHPDTQAALEAQTMLNRL